MIILLVLVCTSFGFGQGKFVFNKDGLSPKHTISKVDGLSKIQLFNKALKWIKATYKKPDTEMDKQIIRLTSIKENAIQADKRYFHMKYVVEISFKEGQYTFKPLEIQTKANSKYDMGWKDFNLNNGEAYFKKGKVIKKTKSYVKAIPAVLNEINARLYDFLTSE
ncbi:DUF4468 domain-containing protein [Hyunsoonleella flava]|uniref:DUF4468 domain-containing protein n=1 Tax=Hyunsoonleella flava TaxID=2527939 RepID=UPI0013EF0622|nr:DUF4468 domain-containing protein [Hyunsoonleella flava]